MRINIQPETVYIPNRQQQKSSHPQKKPRAHKRKTRASKEVGMDWKKEARELMPQGNTLILFAKIDNQYNRYLLIYLPEISPSKQTRKMYCHAKAFTLSERPNNKGVLDKRSKRNRQVNWGKQLCGGVIHLGIKFDKGESLVSICGQSSRYSNIPFEKVYHAI
jgi:hypothetical protein